jgi:DNA-binding response OmpR family regulator
MRILLAEDETTISHLIKLVLSGNGHEVTGVRTVDEANVALQAEGFDLVLLDRNLADGDGTRILESLDARPQRPPVVLMTGERSFTHADELPLTVQAMLWKPFELDELERLVNRFSA